MVSMPLNGLLSFLWTEGIPKGIWIYCVNALKRASFISIDEATSDSDSEEDVSMPLNGLLSFLYYHYQCNQRRNNGVNALKRASFISMLAF